MKATGYLGAVVLAAAVLAGCAGKEEAVTLAVGGTPNELDFWEVIIGEFEKESGINVELQRQPTDTDQRRQSLVLALKSGHRNPDVFLMDVAWIAQIAASGWLEPLDEHVRGAGMDLDAFFTRVVDLADRYDGKLVALPVYVDGGLLYYRKDLLSRHGIDRPPDTWQELIRYSLKVQEKVRADNPAFHGFVWQGAQYEGLICNFQEFAASNGGGIVGPDGRIALDTPANREALRLMYDLIHTHGVSPPNTFTEMKEEEVRLAFQRGDALFERNWPYAWSLHQADGSGVQDAVGIVPLPHFPSGRSASTLGGWHVGISAFSDVTGPSFQLVEFLTSFPVQKKLAMELGWNPGRKDVYTDSEVVAKFPHFDVLRAVFDNALPRPNLPYYTQVSKVLQQHLNAALAGQVTPEKALADAQRDAEKVVKRYKNK